MRRVHLFRRAGPLAGPVRLFCFLSLVLLPPPLGAEAGGGQPRVRDSILGIRIGSSLAEASARLDPLAFREGREGEEEEREREEGRKKAWTLKRTEYQSVALKVNDTDRVVWITGFLRPGKEIPFSRLGDLSLARATDSIVIWNVPTPEGGYRLVARGRGRRATVISLLSLAVAPID
jgi:hypothetical protein